jgi:hypothetical protein
VLQIGTKIIHALKFIRPRTEPAISSGVIAANTNWNQIIAEPEKCMSGNAAAASGMTDCPNSCAAPTDGPGMPRNQFPAKPSQCVPKDML